MQKLETANWNEVTSSNYVDRSNRNQQYENSKKNIKRSVSLPSFWTCVMMDERKREDDAKPKNMMQNLKKHNKKRARAVSRDR